MSSPGRLLLNPRHSTLHSVTATFYFTLPSRKHLYTFLYSLVLVSILSHSCFSFYFFSYFFLVAYVSFSFSTQPLNVDVSQNSVIGSLLFVLYAVSRGNYHFLCSYLYILYGQIPNLYLGYRSYLWVKDVNMKLPTGHFKFNTSKSSLNHSVCPKLNSWPNAA